MYLSTIRLNPARRGAQKLLGSPHALHAAVLAGFPDPAPTTTGRVLWRLDQRQNGATLIIVSPAQPDLTHLAEQAGWPTLDDAWTSRPYFSALQRIEKGQQYAFRLTANPTRSMREAPGTRGKPRGHLTVAQQEKWLLGRQERAGFEVAASVNDEPALIVRDRKLLAFRRRETEVTLRVVTYEGVLTVTDRDALVSTLCQGLGRAKGYGCGLMTLAAPR